MVDHVEPYRGDSLPTARRLAVIPGHQLSPAANWSIRASTGHVRYVERAERSSLEARQPPLGRPAATLASLIPIRKSDAWWDLTQEERRAIFEDRSQHIAASLPYLPAIARRLHHCRELGEPFDFVTWFEYAPEHADRFDELLALLRKTEEWRYVEREVHLRLSLR
jgi:chlorite dismutase